MKTLRYLLGDQLNHQHSWFDTVDDDVIYHMAEMRQETDYVLHHIQKVVAFFTAMRLFADRLENAGHTVIYYKLDDKRNQQDPVSNLSQLIKEHKIQKFEWQAPDEVRLDDQMRAFAKALSIDTQGYDTEHFLTKRDELAKIYEGKKRMTMEYFYREMRRKYDILMLNEKQPEGGKWNFDHANRNRWDEKTPIPPELSSERDVTDILKLLEEQKVKTFGRIKGEKFDWPLTYEEARETLDYFNENLLEHFGTFQDAMHTDQQYLYHSRISFAMNAKIISPLEIVRRVVNYYDQNKPRIDIAQVEGYVRQIIGWREFMRGVYWKEMPAYEKLNKLDNKNKLPDFYWTGNTGMNCLKHCVNDSLDNAYAHHIQRLMVTGNYALLTMTDPDEVDAWYLGVYIDAIQWVELPNTRGMSQWADGGLVATKPYVSSGSYINKMSNYCKSCKYKVSKKKGEEDACPINSLYWNFLSEKGNYFKGNPRMNMVFRILDKMDNETLIAHQKRAQWVIEHPEEV